MNLSLRRLKTEIARNRGKSMALAGLLVVLGIFGVKAFFEMRPRSAAAIGLSESALPAAPEQQLGAAVAAGHPQEMEERVKKSTALWAVLRQTRGVEAAVAFRFDPKGYPLDPNRRVIVTEVAATGPSRRVDITTLPPEVEAKLRREKLEVEARRLLVLRAVLLGAEPSALIDSNGRTELKHAGDVVAGFKIRLIQEQQITVEKDGELIAVVMPKSQMPK